MASSDLIFNIAVAAAAFSAAIVLAPSAARTDNAASSYTVSTVEASAIQAHGIMSDESEPLARVHKVAAGNGDMRTAPARGANTDPAASSAPRHANHE